MRGGNSPRRGDVTTGVAITAFAGLAACLVFIHVYVQQRDPGSSATVENARGRFLNWYSTQRRIALPIQIEDATVLIVEFIDFRCLTCRTAMDTIETAIQRVHQRIRLPRPGGIRLITKDFPLDPDCNPAVAQALRESEVGAAKRGQEKELQPSLHRGACDAAVAVRLAREEGRAAAMQQWLFSQTGKITREQVEVAAAGIGWVRHFAARYESARMLVERDAVLGRAVGVTSVPTIFINGVRIEGILEPQFLEMALEYELSR